MYINIRRRGRSYWLGLGKVGFHKDIKYQYTSKTCGTIQINIILIIIIQWDNIM